MSAADPKRDQARLTLYELLNAAEGDVHNGDEGIDVKSVASLLLEQRLRGRRPE